MAEIENKYGSIVTDVGVQLITEAVMEGQKVNITTPVSYTHLTLPTT